MSIPPYRQIKEHHSPLTVPMSGPSLLRIASTQNMKAPSGRQPVDSIIGSAAFSFNPAPAFQSMQLRKPTFAISPAFIRIGQVAESRTYQLFGRPQKEIQKFLRLCIHRSEDGRRQQNSSRQIVVTYVTKKSLVQGAGEDYVGLSKAPEIHIGNFGGARII